MRLLRGAPEGQRPGLRDGVQGEQAGQGAAGHHHQRQRRALLQAGLQQPDLAEEARHRRDAGQVHRGDEEQHSEQRRETGQPAEPEQGGAAGPSLDQPDDEEQRGLDGDVVRHVEHRTRDARGRAEPDAEHHVADVAHQREREHPLDVGLRHRTEDAHQHGEQRRPQQQVGERALGEQQRLGADDGVDADLGEQAGEDGCHRGRRGRVAVRQPQREREHRGLDGERRQQQQLEHERDGRGDVVDALGDLSEVERADGRVGGGQGGEEEHRRHHVDDDVDRPGAHAGRGAAQGQQHVAGEQQHLEADEQVEQVAGQEGVRDAGHQGEERRVVDRDRGLVGALGRARALVADALPDGVEQHGQGHHGRHQQHQRGEPVGHQRDAEALPAAEPHHLRAVAVGGGEQQRGHDDDGREHDGAHHPLGPRPAVEHQGGSGAEQGQDHGQRHEGVAHGWSAVAARPARSRRLRPVVLDRVVVLLAVGGEVVAVGRGVVEREPPDPAVLHVVLHVVVGVELPAAVRHREQERHGPEGDDDRGEDERLRQRVAHVGRVGRAVEGRLPRRPGRQQEHQVDPVAQQHQADQDAGQAALEQQVDPAAAHRGAGHHQGEVDLHQAPPPAVSRSARTIWRSSREPKVRSRSRTRPTTTR